MVGQGLLPGRALTSSDSLFSDVPWLESRPPDVRGLGGNFELFDSVQVFQPFLRYTRDNLPDPPLWNPHVSVGRPFLANAQSALFTPFNIPGYILPFWDSLAVMAALKLFFGALGAFVLARTLGMRFPGALTTGLIFAFGTFYVVWLSWPLTNIFPLIPWLLVLAERLVRRPAPLPAAGMAGLVALTYFGGHPETTFHTLFATVAYFAVRLVFHVRDERGGLRALARPALTFALAVLGGTAIAAVLIIPFAELLFHSDELTRRTAVAGHWPRKYFAALFLHDYWGRGTQSDIEGFMQIRGWYAGAMTLMLAAVALLVGRTRQRIAAAVVAVAVVMIVLGIDPLFGIVTAIPGFHGAHNERMLIFFLLAVALLAGWGMDDLTDGRPVVGRKRRWVLLTSAAIFLVPFAIVGVAHPGTVGQFGKALDIAWGFADPPLFFSIPDATSPTADAIRLSSLLQWIPLAGLGVVLIAWRLRRTRPLAAGAFVALAVLLLSADLFRANMGFNPAIPERNAAPPTTGAIRYLQSRTPNRFVGVSKQIAFQPLPADIAMDFGLYDARGYDYPAEKRYDTIWRRNVTPGVPDFAQPIQLATATPAAMRVLSLLSVSDLLQHVRGDPIRQPGLRIAYRGRDGVVYNNANALPRVFLAGSQQTVDGEKAAEDAVLAPDFDRRNVVVTERQVPGLPQAGADASASPGSARLVSYGAEKVVAEADARRRSMFVLTDVHYPGWKATVDGRDAPIERVDYLLRGVSLPPGRHTVEFRYEPASFRAGWIISLVGLAGVLAAALVGLRRRRAGTRDTAAGTGR